MKLTNKQKLSIRKSLKLNEDFFDDFDSNDLIDKPVDDFFDEPIDNTDYTYHIQFIIFMYPFVKPDFSDDCEYIFDDPKYEHKLTIESGFLLMKKVLDFILRATPIVSDYSKPKFCSSTEKIIKAFPFMDNKQSNEFEIPFSDNHFITLKTSINLSRRKNINNLTKMFYSFWILQKIYLDLLITSVFNINMKLVPYIDIGVYKNNPYEKSNLCHLVYPRMKLTSNGLELINLLNSKDETE